MPIELSNLFSTVGSGEPNISYVTAVIAIVLFIYVALVLHSRTIESCAMKGCWVADSTFCEQAGLDRMLMYVGDSGDHGILVYILAVNSAGDIIINSAGTVNLRGDLCVIPSIANKRTYEAKFTFSDGQQYECFPAAETIEYNPEKLKMTIIDQKKVVRAIFYRENSLSDIKSQTIKPSGN